MAVPVAEAVAVASEADKAVACHPMLASADGSSDKGKDMPTPAGCCC